MDHVYRLNLIGMCWHREWNGFDLGIHNFGNRWVNLLKEAKFMVLMATYKLKWEVESNMLLKCMENL